MTITVEADIIDGANFAVTSSGISATRIFMVTADENESMATILLEPDLPQRWEPHPDFNTGGTGYYPIYALDITIEPQDRENSIYRVVVGYAQPDYTQQEPSEDADACVIQVGSSVSSGKTQKDNTGAQISVTLPANPDQVGEVEIQLPETVISFERKESASPLIKSVDYTGCVNSVSLGGIYIPRSLLCLGIEGPSTDNGITWQVTYRFQYRTDTWDATVVYIDPETDRPHEDIVLATDTGVTVARVYPEIDFTPLNLPW